MPITISKKDGGADGGKKSKSETAAVRAKKNAKTESGGKSEKKSFAAGKREKTAEQMTKAVSEKQKSEQSAENLPSALPDAVTLPRPVVIVCFGTPTISGDSFGPAVGSLLTEKYYTNAFVYGTTDKPVNGKNMSEWMSFIKSVHNDAVILSVDASLGQKSKIGQIMLRSDGVCPAAVKGKKQRFGDVGVLAVVGESGGDALMSLMQVSPLYINKIADKVAVLVSNSINAL